MKQSQSKSSSDATQGRRSFLKGSSAMAASLALTGNSLAQGVVSGVTSTSAGGIGGSSAAAPNHTLIYVYLRGGADGLSFLAPVGDNSYAGLRQSLALTNTIPVASSNLVPQNTLPSYWGLSRALASLAPQLAGVGAPGAFENGDLAIIPAIGQIDWNKSHFVAQDNMEFGRPPASQNYTGPPISDGFVARHLANANFSSLPPLRGIIRKPTSTVSFLRADRSLAIPNVRGFTFPGDADMREALEAMNTAIAGSVHANASKNSFAAVDYLAGVNFSDVIPPYPMTPSLEITPLGRQFREAADLIKAGNSPEVIEIDLGGWDTHQQQGPNVNGSMYELMEALATAMAGFYEDLSSFTFPNSTERGIDRATVITVSEFGRRVVGNDTGGTDHGKGGLMMAMGGRVNGRIYDLDYAVNAQANPGVNPLDAATDADQDLAVLSDHRDVFARAFRRMMGLRNARRVYLPGFNMSPNFSALFS